MKLPTDLFETYNKMNELINLQCTGICAVFGKKLIMEEERTKDYLNDLREVLKDFNITIEWDNKRKTYYYSKQGVLKFEIKITWEPDP